MGRLSRLRRPALLALAAALLAVPLLAGGAAARPAAAHFELVVVISGNGTVTGPNGVNCRASTSPCDYQNLPLANMTLTGTPDAGWVFLNWGPNDSDCDEASGSACFVQDPGDGDLYRVEAHFNPAPAGSGYPLSVSVTGSGTVTGGGVTCGQGGSTCTVNETPQSVVTLTATPVQGSTFTGWSGACSGSTSTCTVTMGSAQNVGAAFAPVASSTFLLSVGVTGNGTVTGGSINCGVASAACTQNVPPGQSVALTARPGSGATFIGWSGACTGTTTTCTVSMTAAKSVAAAFSGSTSTTPTRTTPTQTTPTQTTPPPAVFPLTVTVVGLGGVTGGGIACGSTGTTCTRSLRAGQVVTLVASTSGGSRFTGWGGACTGAKASCRVTMSTARAVTARFVGGTARNVLLTVSVAGNGTVTGGAVNCGLGGDTCFQSVPLGQSVTLTEQPAPGARFTGWSGACTSLSPICTVTLGTTRSVRASFAGGVKSFLLLVSASGNGRVTGTGISCGAGASACSANFASGKRATLTARPGPGATFTGWSGACAGTTTTCTVTLTAPRNVVATFSGAGSSGSTATLTLTVVGRGSIQASGGLCSSTGAVAKCSQNYSVGAIVRLTALPAANATFYGWSGACAGKRACTITMTAAKQVVASFAGGGPVVSQGTPFNLRSLGDPSVGRSGAHYRVTLRFLTTQAGNGTLRIIQGGHTVEVIRLHARSGKFSFGPFVVAKGGQTTIVLTLTDLSGRTRTLRWQTCLGQCQQPPTTSTTTTGTTATNPTTTTTPTTTTAPTTTAPPPAKLELVRGQASVTPSGSSTSVTLHFTSNEQVAVSIQVYRNGVAALKTPVKLSFPRGAISVGPFGLNQNGTYRFALVAIDPQGRRGSLEWVVTVP